MSSGEAELAPEVARSATDRLQRARLRPGRLVMWSAVLALVAASIYVVIVATLWSNRVSGLHHIAADLEDQRVEAESTQTVDGVALAQLHAELDYLHTEFLVSANHSVRAKDYALYLSYLGVWMGYCVDASEDVEYYVRTKWGHIPQPIHDYDNAVREACMEIRGYFTEAVDAFDEELPAPEPTKEPS